MTIPAPDHATGDAKSSADGGSEPALIRLLGWLSRKNCSARLCGGTESEPGVCIMRSNAQGGHETVQVFAARVLDIAARAGWVIAQSGGEWRISESGRRRLAASVRPNAITTASSYARAPDLSRQSATEVNDSESPLAWLRRRRDRSGAAFISEAEFAAGERLRADFTLAQMMPRVTVNWSAAGGTGHRYGTAGHVAEVSDRAAAAGQRVRRALTAVGPEFEGILLDVCCFLKGLERIERDAQWPQRSAKIFLQMALRALARHYGISR